MSVIAAYYSKTLGSWVIGKNRDSKKKPLIRIRKSFRREIERLYIWEEHSKFTEGLSEYGIGIVSVNTAEISKDPETEADVKVTRRTLYSPEGLRIRTALFESNINAVVKKLIELEIPGNIIIADTNRCFVLEGAFLTKGGIEEYAFKTKEVAKNQIVVRTGHGIFLPWAGISADEPMLKADRNSSELRYKAVAEQLVDVITIQEFLDVLSDRSDKNPQLNVLRNDETRGKDRTTGQIIIVPGECTLFYRPVWGELQFDMESINKSEEKTFFEVISNRKLLTPNEENQDES